MFLLINFVIFKITMSRKKLSLFLVVFLVITFIFFFISLNRYSYAQPVFPSWTVKLIPVCPAGSVQKQPLRMFRIIWPDKGKGTGPFNCETVPLNNNGRIGMRITSSEEINNIYVGLESPIRDGKPANCSEGISFKPISISPIPSQNSYNFGKYMNPQNWMAFWKRNDLSPGNYTIEFEVPEEYCK